jgi:hypothetical protein
MGLTLTLNDQELPASPAFIEFLHATLTGGDHYVGSWFTQEDESMHRDEERFEGIQEKAKQVVANPKGTQYVLRSYRFFKEMLTGRLNTLNDVRRFRYFFVIGIPRTGGTYVTKQLFRAGGMDYTKVHNALAHDGFPHLAHLALKDTGNVHTTGLLQLAEWLTMVHIYFTQYGRLAWQGGVIVPKKFTKAVYYFDLVRELFGESSYYLLTLRHPLAVVQSVLDKAGGMPEGRKFAVRSAIERWALDDWGHWGTPPEELFKMNYVEVMCGYWRRFHYQLALAGIPRMPTTQLIPYGQKYMLEAVTGWYRQFGVPLEPEPFKVAQPPKFPAAEEKMAEKALEDVTNFWSSLGLKFPAEELRERL